MISVIIPTLNAEVLLARCFDSLITAAVRGVVRGEALSQMAALPTRRFLIADAAGARIVASPYIDAAASVAAGAAAARADWFLFLHPGTALEPGWENEAESFIDRASSTCPRAAFHFALEDFRGAGASRRGQYCAAGRSRCPIYQGLLIPRRLYQRLGGYRALPAMEDADLVRRIGRRRSVMMQACAVNVQFCSHESVVRHGALAPVCRTSGAVARGRPTLGNNCYKN